MKDNSFWSTTQGKSTIKFAAWMIFIIILIVIFAINGKPENNNINNTQEKNEEIISFEKYETMQDNLLNGCFNYEYKIIEKNITTIYTGKKLNDTEIGYKETKDGIIKYIKDKDITYKVVLDEKEELPNLYDEADKSFLNINIIFENLKEYLYNITKNESTREINYNKEGYKVVVKTDLKNITNITIENENKTYELQFTNVGKCDNITNK